MSHAFYQLSEYRLKQSVLTKKYWREGKFVFLCKKEKRICARKDCGKQFEIIPSVPRIFCSHSCAAKVNNTKRRWSQEVKQRISVALKGKQNPYRGTLKVPRVEMVCSNPACKIIFLVERYKIKTRKFCSNQCAMDIIGGQTTSPRAARGKAGIRKDISDTIYFYSRWEANIARLYNYIGIQWKYAPTTFQLDGQTYTPDFYLPKRDIYVEVKNFWWRYSKERDEKFRKLYPSISLEVILKSQYLALEKKYAKLIPAWEYKNSVFCSVS
ncbi:MAG: hypothetical protein HYV78_00155 [Candidatus Wildermuthbacteria bacterium]|nr:hypothetical protein [Candidatus Wildermuthbacteria bacterium]